MIAILLAGTGVVVYSWDMRNPYPDVDWISDMPGATERYITFTPVLKNNRNIKLGPTLGADYAVLRFLDLDDDGKKEAVIKTHILIDTGEYYHPSKHILKHSIDSKTGYSKFEKVKMENLYDI